MKVEFNGINHVKTIFKEDQLKFQNNGKELVTKSINEPKDLPLSDVPIKNPNIVYDSKDGIVVRKDNNINPVNEKIEDINIK